MDALEQGLPEPDLARLAAEARPDPVRPEITGHEIWKDDEGIWWTSFPPPAGFDGEERGEFREDRYERTLSAQEQSVLDAELDERDAEYRASETDRRDRFFGFAGGQILTSREAEPYETSEPSGDDDPPLGPMEYKSLVAPCPTGGIPLFENSAPLTLTRLRRQKSRIARSAPAKLAPRPSFKKRPALRLHHIQSRSPRHPC